MVISVIHNRGLTLKGGLELRESYKQDEAEDFFDREYQQLFHYAVYLVKNEQTAQDLCQEAFIRWFNLPNPGIIKFPRAWLKKVLSNLAFNYLRHQQLRLKREVAGQENCLLVSTDMQEDLTRIEVEDVLTSLPLRDQILLKMKMGGLSYAEMAEVMNVSKNSVGVMLIRAMKKFRNAYQGKEADEKDELSGRRPTLTLRREGTNN